MRYAIVNTSKAEEHGLKKAYHVLSNDKKSMIVNENELRVLGDADKEAKRLGGKLMSRKELNNIINSEIWHKNK